jgi:glutathione S-transferase
MTSTLYLHPFSSYRQKAKIAFYEKGVAFETKMLDSSEPVAGEFAALWPIGKFPVLALAAEWQQLGEPIGADAEQNE